MYFLKVTQSDELSDGIKFKLSQRLEMTPRITTTPIRMSNPEVYVILGNSFLKFG